MSTFTFTIVVDRRPTDDELGVLLAASDGGDVIFGTEQGQTIAEFDREHATMADAVVSAVHTLESIGLTALRVVDQDLLTLADIADRIGQSRESIRRYATGARGAGGFPPPANPSRDGTVFYRWTEVAPWLRTHLGPDIPDTDPALVVANLIVQARRHRGRVAHMSALTSLLAV